RRRPAMTTVAPSSTNSSTVRAPMPLVPPTITATLPSSTFTFIFSCIELVLLAPHHNGTRFHPRLGDGAPPVAARPPSSIKWVPVILADSSEQKYSTAFATDSGLLYEPVGMPARIAAPIAAGSVGFLCASIERIMRVSTGPGQIAFTRTPKRATSAAAAL